MQCGQCRTQMETFREENVQGCRCPKCGWEIVTTYIDEIYLDTTEYQVNIKCNQNVGAEKIKALSDVAGVNFIRARKILLEGGICVKKGLALEIRKALQALDEAEVDYEVKPEFKWGKDGKI